MPHIPTLSLVIPLLGVLLSACAHAPDTVPPDHGVLQLRETLYIEPNAATARLQYGHVVARNAVQEQDPFCVFEINTVRPERQTVAPAAFRIIGISRSVETIAGVPVFPLTWQIRRVSFGDDESPTHIYYKTTFRLSDTEQPVRALTCMSNQAAPGNTNAKRHLTLAEIRGTLGTWFVLH